MSERRIRWTLQDVGMTIWAKRYIECECGGDAWVLEGTVRCGVVDRRLQCICGRKWRQIIY